MPAPSSRTTASCDGARRGELIIDNRRIFNLLYLQRELYLSLPCFLLQLTIKSVEDSKPELSANIGHLVHGRFGTADLSAHIPNNATAASTPWVLFVHGSALPLEMPLAGAYRRVLVRLLADSDTAVADRALQVVQVLGQPRHLHK